MNAGKNGVSAPVSKPAAVNHVWWLVMRTS